MHRFLIPLPVAAVLLATAPVAAQNAVQPPSRTLTVTAGADVAAVPDRAVVQLGVQTRASNAQTAMAQNNTLMAQVVAALKALGIPDNQLQTSSVTLTPVYNNPPPQTPAAQPQLIGFDASNIVIAQLTDLTKVGPAIDAAVGAGANQIQSIAFQVANDEPYRLTALQQAGALARAKAQALATGLGVTIGDVDAAVEGSFQATPVYNGGAAPTASPAVPVLPGQIILHTDIQVRFTLK